MARVDYFDIANEVKEVLIVDSSLQGVQVTVEDDAPLDSGAWVSVVLVSRNTPPGQPLAAGTRTRFQIKFSLWCWQFSLESTGVASRLRDDLVGKAEIALMKNRTLNSKVSTSWLEGGDMMSDRIQNDNVSGYIAGGEVVLIVELTASTL